MENTSERMLSLQLEQLEHCATLWAGLGRDIYGADVTRQAKLVP